MSGRSKRKRRQSIEGAGKPSSLSAKPLVPSPPLGDHTRDLLVSQRQQFTVAFSGPLPPPEVLRQYNEIVPGLASRIVAQAEAQTAHRISLENKVIDSDTRRSRQGLVCGFVVSLLCVAGGIVAVLMGHDWAGATIATGAVVALTGVFVYGTAMRRSERTEKAKIMTGQK